jgi:uncharacterized FAD-dependent dehydrogenase
MIRIHQLRLPLDHPPEALPRAAADRLGVAVTAIRRFSVFRRSLDARHAPAFVYSVDVEAAGEESLLRKFAGDGRIALAPDMSYRFVTRAPRRPSTRPVIVGFGPAGIFAALVLAQMGFGPLVLERGKPVRERAQDTWRLWRENRLDPESNVQFGEGGAGTFSDGKLYSQIRDPRQLARKVLEEFVEAGAPEEILYAARPHIGTFRLVGMVERMRAKIESLGGDVRFRSRVDGLAIESGRVRGVTLGGEEIEASQVVLAPGHSARDTFAMLRAKGVAMEAKPFAVGLRIEHPQTLIDQARLGPNTGNPRLGAADYKLVCHAGGRSVYSFCMCPGGQVVAATSEPGCVVTNGMSQYSRAERNANAGLVVDVSPADFGGPGDPLAGIAFQRRLEARAFELGGGTYEAPAQRLDDFIAGRASTCLGSVTPSYQPGVRLTDLSTALPEFAVAAIRAAIPAFDRKIHGFALPDAILTGVETRTSSPLRLTRGDDLQSVNVKGLYPAGEGAGYAGGILSAAIDGIRIAEAVALQIMDTLGASRC